MFGETGEDSNAFFIQFVFLFFLINRCTSIRTKVVRLYGDRLISSKVKECFVQKQCFYIYVVFYSKFEGCSKVSVRLDYTNIYSYCSYVLATRWFRKLGLSWWCPQCNKHIHFGQKTYKLVVFKTYYNLLMNSNKHLVTKDTKQMFENVSVIKSHEIENFLYIQRTP